jgi:hypothetical protein
MASSNFADRRSLKRRDAEIAEETNPIFFSGPCIARCQRHNVCSETYVFSGFSTRNFPMTSRLAVRITRQGSKFDTIHSFNKSTLRKRSHASRTINPSAAGISQPLVSN